MQFHLNGFRRGDPDLHRPENEGAADVQQALPEEVDVLIVGCGPAGLTLAAQLARFPEIRTCIAEQRSGPLELGQADGVACRTMEMFNAFGFVDRVLREAYWVNETCFWKPADDPALGIVRSGRVDDTEKGLSEFPHVILNQARVHEFYLDLMRRSPSGLVPHYGRRLVEVRVDPDGGAKHRATAIFETTGPDGTTTSETIRARYVVGCDGARSMVRRSLDLELKGDAANQAWGVMDLLAVTDFPDIRLKAVINSADAGSIVLIPREGGYLIRLYVEMDELDAGERVSARKIEVEDVIAQARRVLHPYTLNVQQVAWWSVYEIGQRLTDQFDDVPPAQRGTREPCVFIAGDACHTHSPKAGQGMNVSMQDAFNLGWKLAAVLRGQADPRLLDTYTAERQVIARELIEFDREWAKMLSSPLRSEQEPEGVDPSEVQAYFVNSGHYTAGTATRYADPVLTGQPTHQHLATGFPLGKRFHSAPVTRVADAKPMWLGHAIEADGRWRIFAFADLDGAAPGSRLDRLCTFLTQSPSSPIARHQHADQDVDAMIDVRAVVQDRHDAIDLGTVPPLLLPNKGQFGLLDYEKLFAVSPDADIFDARGIARDTGCMIVVRPDQYVAQILPLDDYDTVSAYFESFLLPKAD